MNPTKSNLKTAISGLIAIMLLSGCSYLENTLSNPQKSASVTETKRPALVHLQIAQSALEKGDFQTAQAGFMETLAIEPRNAAAHEGLANLEFRQNRVESAKTWLKQAILIEDSAQRRNLMGRLLDRTGQHAKACHQFTTGLALDPENAEIKANLAVSWALSGQIDRSIPLIEDAVRQPDSAQREHLLAGLIYGAAGHLESARITLAGYKSAENQQVFRRFSELLKNPRIDRVLAISDNPQEFLDQDFSSPAVIARTPKSEALKQKPEGQYRIQLEAFRDAENARKAPMRFASLIQKNLPLEILESRNKEGGSGGINYRIRSAPLVSLAAAKALCASIAAQGQDCLPIKHNGPLWRQLT